MKPILLIFVKAPTPGRVKTRLRPLLSADEAAQLYRCLAQDTLAAARRVTGVRVAIAYAANAQFPDCSWLDAQAPVVLQEGADLGERLARAFRWAFRRKAQRVVIIGSDAPGLSARWLAQAFRELERADAVLGPTTDGGYHLIGLNEANPALFAGMPWSTSRLLAKTLGRIGQLHVSVECLKPIADLDTPDDVRRYAAGLDGRRARTHTARYLATLKLR